MRLCTDTPHAAVSPMYMPFLIMEPRPGAPSGLPRMRAAMAQSISSAAMQHMRISLFFAADKLIGTVPRYILLS